MTCDELQIKLDNHAAWLRGKRSEPESFKNCNLDSHDLENARLQRADFTGASMQGAYLVGADLRGAKLCDVNLYDAELRDVDLTGACLTRANLKRAWLLDARLAHADCSSAVFASANLANVDFAHADVTGADLSRAHLMGTKFEGTDLTKANLSKIKRDLQREVRLLRDEIPFLTRALRAGRVDGTSYHGACRCLAGTLLRAAGVRSVDSERVYKNGFRAAYESPREKWFTNIRPGDTPENNQVAAITLGWLQEVLAEPVVLGKVSRARRINISRWLHLHKGGVWKYDGRTTWWCDDNTRHVSRVCVDSDRDDGGGSVGYHLYGGNNPGWVHFTDAGK